jgi:hypothetical protein
MDYGTVQNITFFKASFKIFFENKTVKSVHHAGFLSKRYTIKKRLAIFPSPAGMSLIKLYLAENNFIILRQVEFDK